MFITLAGLTMCGKNEVLSNEDEWDNLTGDTPISFNTSTSTLQTKTTTSLEPNTHFGVFAFYQPGVIGGASGEWSSSCTPNFMYDQDVRYNGSTYSYSPIKYWPNNQENTISFWAYFPHDASGLSFKTSTGYSYSNSSTGVPVMQFNAVTGKGLIDLMLADFDNINQSKPTLGTSVNFTFRHLLSRVIFRFTKTDDNDDNFTVLLRDVRITNIYNTADNANGSWSSYSNQSTLSVYQDTTPEDDSDNLVVPKTGADDMVLMPIPQPLYGTDAKISITYLVIPSGSSVGDEINAEVYVKDLHDGWSQPTDGWEKNTQYTYNVNITPGNPIGLFVTVTTTPWDIVSAETPGIQIR